MADVTERQRLGSAIKRRREALGLTQAQLAERIGTHKQTVVKYERGDIDISWERFRSIADALETVIGFLMADGMDPEAESDPAAGPRVSEASVHYSVIPAPDGDEAWRPNPSLRGQIPDRAYRMAMEYCRRLVEAGIPREEVETMERVMIDSRYAKANRRKGRELTEEDWMLLVDDAWDAIRETLSSQGVHV